MVTRDIVQRLLNVINDTRRRVNTLESREYVLLNATQTLTNKTLTTPSINNFTNAQHSHANVAGGGQLSLTTAVSGVLPAANGGTGVNNATRTLTISTNSGTLAFSGAGFTLTVPATGTAALLGAANVFTAAQTINAGLIVDTNVLVVDSTNNRVGIGTATPSQRLHIVDTGDLSLRAENATYKLDFGVDGTSSFFQSRTAANAAAPLLIYIGSTARFAIDVNGNVGIGTTSPGAKLDVSSTNGGVNSGIRLIQAAENASTQNSYVPIDFTVPTSGLIGQFLATANNYVPSGFTSLSANALSVVSQATSGHLLLGAGGTNGYINFITGGYASANERMRITKEGNVGIGTVSPSAQLHVNQSSASGAKPTLRLRQADLSEEFIRFDATVAAGNPINTTALGAYYGRVRVHVEGVGAKWLALYD